MTISRYLVPPLTKGSGGGGHGHILHFPVLGKGQGSGDHSPFLGKGRGQDGQEDDWWNLFYPWAGLGPGLVLVLPLAVSGPWAVPVLVVLVMAIYHTFLFWEREGVEVVVVLLIYPHSSFPTGKDWISVPYTLLPLLRKGIVLMARYLAPLLTKGIGGSGHGHIPHLPLRGKGSGGGDPFLFWDREWL